MARRGGGSYAPDLPGCYSFRQTKAHRRAVSVLRLRVRTFFGTVLNLTRRFMGSTQSQNGFYTSATTSAATE